MSGIPTSSRVVPDPPGHREHRRNDDQLRSIDAALDDALCETFPASDAIAVHAIAKRMQQ